MNNGTVRSIFGSLVLAATLFSASPVSSALLPRERPFSVNGFAWATRERFIHSARCATADLPAAEQANVAARLDAFRKLKKRESLRRDQGDQLLGDREVVNIDVHYHVITAADGRGDVTRRDR